MHKFRRLRFKPSLLRSKGDSYMNRAYIGENRTIMGYYDSSYSPETYEKVPRNKGIRCLHIHRIRKLPGHL